MGLFTEFAQLPPSGENDISNQYACPDGFFSTLGDQKSKMIWRSALKAPKFFEKHVSEGHPSVV
ncbi:hypothetical protein [Nonomuraea guangzhouensis]|uniref:Uncharacterized protein n=1 Tax=Nonomuraea guangzhouensis TaxID=1291555 RepID=A0ABW4G0R9_9ACTN|nr:hypothetical protein [Nonomuraea guangzhouensis]